MIDGLRIFLWLDEVEKIVKQWTQQIGAPDQHDISSRRASSIAGEDAGLIELVEQSHFNTKVARSFACVLHRLVEKVVQKSESIAMRELGALQLFGARAKKARFTATQTLQEITIDDEVQRSRLDALGANVARLAETPLTAGFSFATFEFIALLFRSFCLSC